MKEYIEREALLEEIKVKANTLHKFRSLYTDQSARAFDGLAEYIAKISAADVALVRHGKWKILNRTESGVEAECSECKYKMIFGMSQVGKYCPNCGAYMGGGNK